ncbi:hypothetical protein NMK71_01685 [Weeksellaceae bacterium KMM 9713]|uniref:DNA replication protein DnaC n=1 Tax=Profundicola chukchiensis TaxID=2961959 RepID=A0A9X4MUM1_9FLAO|nr:hypothetical protein [Profundicola chukchiensis]MDG4945113.1 hypothetical protein [Profundicola chukchiensis]
MEAYEKKKKINITEEFIREATNIINYGRSNGSKKLILDDFSKEYFKLVVDYFLNNPQFIHSRFIKNYDKGDLYKGLYIYGNCGIGKTLSFKTINAIAQKNSLFYSRLWFHVSSALDIVSYHNSEGDKSLLKLYNGNLYIDDLGSEDIGNYFGKKEVLTQVLEKRYRLFTEKGLRTYITSNINPVEFKERYGVRLYDRMLEMFNVVKLDQIQSYRR